MRMNKDRDPENPRKKLQIPWLDLLQTWAKQRVLPLSSHSRLPFRFRAFPHGTEKGFSRRLHRKWMCLHENCSSGPLKLVETYWGKSSVQEILLEESDQSKGGECKWGKGKRG